MLANAPTTEAKELKEAVTQTNIKYDQLRLDLGQLATSITANEWTCSENHIFTLSMEARSTWRDQHATISKNLIVIDGLAKLHNLTDLQDRIADIRSETVALSSRMELIILKIEATPTKLPSYSGDASEDLTNLEDKFQTAAMDNRISRRNQLERIRAGLTSETAAKLPLNGMIDTEEARPCLREAFDNPYTNIHCRRSRTGQTPGLTDRLVKTDPAHAATWFLDYGNAVKEMLHLGG